MAWARAFRLHQAYGQGPGGQASFCVSRGANTHQGAAGPPDDVSLPLRCPDHAWQAIEYAACGTAARRRARAGDGDHVVGRAAQLVSRHRRDLSRTLERGGDAAQVPTCPTRDDLGDYIREMTQRRGPTSVLDPRQGGSRFTRRQLAPRSGRCPTWSRKGLQTAAPTDSTRSIRHRHRRRGSTISLIGVYGGMADPLRCYAVDKQIHCVWSGQREALVTIMPLDQTRRSLGRRALPRTSSAPDDPAAYERSRKAGGRRGQVCAARRCLRSRCAERPSHPDRVDGAGRATRTLRPQRRELPHHGKIRARARAWRCGPVARRAGSADGGRSRHELGESE